MMNVTRKTTTESDLDFKSLNGFEGEYEINRAGFILSLKIYNNRKPNYIIPMKADEYSGELFVRLYDSKNRTWYKYFISNLIYNNYTKPGKRG